MLMEIRAEQLARLVKELSNLYGGEPTHIDHNGEVIGGLFLEEYIAEVLKEWSNTPKEQKAAIACFMELIAQAKLLGRRLPIKDKGRSRIVPKLCMEYSPESP